MIQQCVLVGSIVGSICGFLASTLILLAIYLHFRRLKRVEIEPATVPDSRHNTTPPQIPVGELVLAENPFSRSWATLQQLSEKARNLSSCCSGIRLLVTESSLSSSDIDHAIALIKAFGPVYGQESPQRLHKLFSSPSTQVRYLAIDHFIHTSLVSSIRLESDHIQLLSPPLTWFFRHCYTSNTQSRPNFHSSFAQIRGILPNILPNPNTEQAQADMAAYLLKIISPFLEKKHLKDVQVILGSAVKEFSEFGNMMLLEPKSWEWDYTHQRFPEDYIVIFPKFHQVRDESGAPTKGQHIVDAQILRLDWNSTTH
ncbi:MAG: hypothetical protein M1830_001014 [Pleopsidium flavum]|nr:MAG: hypothetical protein M1830_001014 [Pleopsidium flavum]